jgi:hypothetical protein
MVAHLNVRYGMSIAPFTLSVNVRYGMSITLCNS